LQHWWFHRAAYTADNQRLRHGSFTVDFRAAYTAENAIIFTVNGKEHFRAAYTAENIKGVHVS